MKKIAFASGLCLMTVGAVSAQDWPTDTIRYANWIPASFVTARIDQFVVDEIAARTDGAVEIEIFHGGALGGPGEMVEMVGAGAIDIGNFPISYFFSQFPVASLNDSLPMLFETAADAAQLARESYDQIDEVRAELDAANLHPFLYRGLPQYRMICTRPVANLADLQGLKVRTYGSFTPPLFQAFGAVPVDMELGELYDGLQRGTVDCVFLNYQTAALFRLYEVADYTSDAEFGATPLYLGYINKDVWDSWSDDFRSLFNEVVEEAEVRANNEIETEEAAGLQTLLDNGVTLIPFTDQARLEAEAPDFLELWVERVSAAGKPEAARAHADFIRRRLSELASQ
ncbi:C4-dicarboxylate TRAP transporter substrate-binding protein [Pararhodobacter oceanensis]|uniref:C4-dicarboxylate TRAP transporter substrate-binding protein n=1 Tax=Pararhodobacter oceanensis TaxID=2172121 RepID=UPI003A920501